MNSTLSWLSVSISGLFLLIAISGLVWKTAIWKSRVDSHISNSDNISERILAELKEIRDYLCGTMKVLESSSANQLTDRNPKVPNEIAAEEKICREYHL